MGDQMKLLFTLSNANAANDNQTFYDNEIKPILESLVKQGVKDLNFISLLGDTIPHICAYNSLPNTLDSIYQFCLNNHLNLDLTRCDLKVGQTPIDLAACMGNKDLVTWFLVKAKDNPNPNLAKVIRRRPDESGKLPVHFAASFTHDETIRDDIMFLLDPLKTWRHIPDFNGFTAEYVKNNPGFVYPGSESCPVLRDCFGQTEFTINVFMRNIEGLQSALVACESDEERKVLVNAQDYCGRSALIYACYMGYSDVVDILMPYADVNQADNRGQLPLHFAVLYLNKVQPSEGQNNTQIIQRLLDYGAKNLANDFRETPANFAFIMGSALGNLESMMAVANMISPMPAVKSESSSPSSKTYLPALTASMQAVRVSERKEQPVVKTTPTTTVKTATTPDEGFQVPDTRRARKAQAQARKGVKLRY